MGNSCVNIGLGTAQFGGAYGVSNFGHTVSDKDLRTMLSLARCHGIRTIDTAAAYGDSEQRLGEHGLEDFDIVTKVFVSMREQLDNLETQIQRTLSDLKIEHLDAVLVHNAEAIPSSALVEALGKLDRMIGRGICKRIGVSLYEPRKIIEIAKIHRIDLVQVPFNAIDQRLSDGNVLSWCQNKGIDLHVRSVFLQGLLLMNRKSLPSYFKPWLNVVDKWLAWNCLNDTSPLEGALGFVNGYKDKGISRLIIGSNNAEHLSAFIRCANVGPTKGAEALRCDDLKLINPALWNLP